MNTLLAKEYIGKNFSSDDRLLGRYASYFLLPNGLALLKYNGDPKALKLMRKDATASERFVTHCIAIGDVAADLLRLYHDAESIQFSTKTELMREDYNTWDGSDDHEFIYNYFPQPLPDGSLNFYRDIDDDDHHCFVEVWQDTIPFWVYRKRIQYYIEYTDEGAWGDANSVAKQPPVLLVCDSPTLQRRVQRYLKRIVDEIDSDELKFLVVNRELLAKAEADAAIWHTYDEDQEKFVICKLN